MPDLRPDSVSRLYSTLTATLSNGLYNVNCGVRSLGHTCRAQLHRLRPGHHSGASASNPFVDSHDNSEQASPTVTTETSNVSAPPPSSSSSQRSHQRHGSHRSSSHRRLYREREHRHPYHLYRNGLISVRTLDKDRNVLAAILSTIVIASLATALSQPKWFSIYNDLCAQNFFSKSDTPEKGSNGNAETGPSSIFDARSPQYTQYRVPYYYNGPFHSVYSSTYALAPVTIYGLSPDFKNCANPQILALKRTIIGLCFLAIMCTLVQFFMDTMGTRKKWVNTMRQYALGNILCVLLCVLIVGLCYLISILYERVQLQQLTSRSLSPPKSLWIKPNVLRLPLSLNQFDYLTVHQIEVKFELSYYLVTLAGFLSILASAANLFRRPRQIFIERLSEVNACRGSRYRPNADESSLLGCDVLNNNNSTESPTGLRHQAFPPLPPYYSPNEWLFNPNWSLFYSGAPVAAANPPPLPPPPPSSTNPHSYPHVSHNIHSHPVARPGGIPVVPVPPPCPPPPPYSP